MKEYSDKRNILYDFISKVNAKEITIQKQKPKALSVIHFRKLFQQYNDCDEILLMAKKTFLVAVLYY